MTRFETSAITRVGTIRNKLSRRLSHELEMATYADTQEEVEKHLAAARAATAAMLAEIDEIESLVSDA